MNALCICSPPFAVRLSRPSCPHQYWCRRCHREVTLLDLLQLALLELLQLACRLKSYSAVAAVAVDGYDNEESTGVVLALV